MANRFFIGPLTVAQQRRRDRARENFREAQEIADARYISMRDAFAVLRAERDAYWSMVFTGNRDERVLSP